jgi:hypothetical protein
MTDSITHRLNLKDKPPRLFTREGDVHWELPIEDIFSQPGGWAKSCFLSPVDEFDDDFKHKTRTITITIELHSGEILTLSTGLQQRMEVRPEDRNPLALDRGLIPKEGARMIEQGEWRVIKEDCGAPEGEGWIEVGHTLDGYGNRYTVWERER